MGEIDLAPAIYGFCLEDDYVDPHCEAIDLDGNGVLDAQEPEEWAPAKAIGKVCVPELDPPQCSSLHLDYDGVCNADDNCPNDANPDQTDTDLDGVGDACEESEDADGDGIADEFNLCPNSDLRPSVLVAGCDTGVTNRTTAEGCSLGDLIGQCADRTSDHGAFVSCVSHLANTWKTSRIITGREKGPIAECAAQSDIE